MTVIYTHKIKKCNMEHTLYFARENMIQSIIIDFMVFLVPITCVILNHSLCKLIWIDVICGIIIYLNGTMIYDRKEVTKEELLKEVQELPCEQ